MFRAILAGAVVVSGIGLSISQLVQHHWISAVGYLIAGLLTGLLILLGISSNYEHPAFVFGFGVVSALGLLAVFSEHRAFEHGRAEVLAEGVDVFVRLDPLQCPIAPSRVHYLQEAGVKACAMQGISDQLDAAQALHRANVVPPEMSVPDGMLQAFEKDKPDPCIRLLREIQQSCPHVLPRGLDTKLAALRR